VPGSRHGLLLVKKSTSPSPHQKKKTLKKHPNFDARSLKVCGAPAPRSPNPERGGRDGGGWTHTRTPPVSPAPATWSGDAETLAVPHLIKPHIILNGSNVNVDRIRPVTAGSGIPSNLSKLLISSAPFPPSPFSPILGCLGFFF